MAITDGVILFSLGSLLRLDILVWLLALPLFFIGLLCAWWQYREGRLLNAELAILKRQNVHSIEYDLVLKAMKLSIWRIDVATHTLAFEVDYRDGDDNLTTETSITIDQFYSFVSPKHKEQVKKGLSGLMDGAVDEFHMQYQVLLPSNTKYYWSESFATVDKRDSAGRPIVIVGTSMRIDQQKRIEQQLIEARNHAEESDRLKTAFLANISHEIRTPLNAIVGFSEVLPMAQTNEERKALVKLINENNDQLLRLFGDLVNMSKMEAGGGAVRKLRFPLKTLFEEVVAEYEHGAKKKGLSIVIAPMEHDMVLKTDRSRLREILNQYVNNAIKFTTSGSVTLGCSSQPSGLRIWVRDTGKGIPAAHCNSQLFERFYKLDEFVPGTGIGLSICRSMALSLGGTVGVSSKLGEGSTFWVDLMLE